MPTKFWKIEDIGDLDNGRTAAHINKHLQIALRDCANRPGLKDKRRVNIVLEITPNQDGESGVVTDVDIEAIASNRVPKSRSRPSNMRLHPNGEALFNPASNDDAHQGTIDDVYPTATDKENPEG